MSKKYWAIIPAAGSGTRMNADIPKQYLVVQGKTILEHTLTPFLNSDLIYKIVIAVAKEDAYWPEIHNRLDQSKILVISGGKERVDSVAQGLAAISDIAATDDGVLIHDAVRPCIDVMVIHNLIKTLEHHPVGGLFGIPVRDTLKKVNQNTAVIETIPRDQVWQAQTPQLFGYGLLTKAIREAMADNLPITDEASAIEYLGLQPFMVLGTSNNIKITFPEDLDYLERWLVG
jgi:2-C-methyl-D-erythritol 4-phosphate cytidylyltransferase